MQGWYERSLRWSLEHRWLIWIAFAGSLVATGVLFSVMPQDFLPTADQGQIFGLTEAANGTSFDQMVRYQQQAAAIVAQDPNIDGFMSSVGSGGSSSGTNSGRIFASLKPLDQRAHTCLIAHLFCWHALSADEIVRELRPKLSRVAGINTYMQVPPSIRIGGRLTKSQYQYTLQDLDQDELQTASLKLMNALSDRARLRRT